jgi:catechol 2,3-dioxygenase-like lactoylglutathione lyase family enzyme
MTERPVFNQVNLIVDDMARAAAFYEKLGFEIESGEYPPGSGAFHGTIHMPGGIDIDFDTKPMAAVWHAGWRDSGRGSQCVLGFSVPSPGDVDRVYGELTAAGYEGRQPPYDAMWGSRYAIVEDPDGNDVGIMSPADPERAAPPPGS